MSSFYRSASEIVLDTLYRLRARPMRDYPFTHFYCDEIFDNDLLDALQSFWPNQTRFRSISETTRVRNGSYKERFLVALDDLTSNNSLDGPGDEFWRLVKASLGGDDFLSGVCAWLLPAIRQVRNLPQKIRLTSEVLLTEDLSGYGLSPHTDAPSRLATILFFVPVSNEIEFAGTSLYVSKTDKYGNAISPAHRPREDFEKVYTVPFRRNTALGFVVGPTSFHGVEKMPELEVSRRVIQYCVRWSEL